MTKNDLIESVAATGAMTKVQAGKAVNMVLKAVTEALSRGESVAITGFGTFTVRERAGRTVRNPSGGDMVKVPPRRVPSFKPGKQLRDRVAA